MGKAKFLSMTTKQNIVVVGLNHKTAPVEVRECLAFAGDDPIKAMNALCKKECVDELLLFSTCNRVEFLLISDDITCSVETVKDFMAEFKKTRRETFEQNLYVYSGDEAVRHIFRVAASLDSMVVGEPQILGQIKAAYHLAVEHGRCSVILNRLMHRAFSVGKRIRTETGIGDSAVSISYAAVQLARKILGNLEDKAVMLLGAGEMAELAVEHLVADHARPIFVANRTFERGLELAERFNGTAIRFEEVRDHLKRVDIVISSTGAPHYVVVKDDFNGVMRERKRRPLFFIDIAVPRDIDPDINKIANVYVYDIDDLRSAIEENIQERKQAAIQGERIVDESVIQFRRWLQSLCVAPTIVALREKAEQTRLREVAKTFAMTKSLSVEQKAAIDRLTTSIVNKMLHDPTLLLKKYGHTEHSTAQVDLIRRLYSLDQWEEQD